MKQNRDHIVPLTPLMLSILREIPEQPNGRFVFSYSFGERPWCYGGKYKADFDEAVQVEAGKIGKTFEPGSIMICAARCGTSGCCHRSAPIGRRSSCCSPISCRG